MRMMAAVLVLFAWAGPARAQDMVFAPSMSWPESASISQFGLLASQARARADEGERATAAPRATEKSLTFVSSPTRRQANYATFVDRSRQADPAGAADLAATLNADPIAAMAPELAKVGLATDNVADAYALYWIEAWQAVHGAFETLPRSVAVAVKQQAGDAILRVPSYAGLTDPQKQEFADALLIQALLVASAKEAAKADPARLRQVGDAVGQGATGLGLDLRAMTLTGQGFVAKR